MDPVNLATIASLLGVSARDFFELYRQHLKKAQEQATEAHLAARYQRIGEILSCGVHTHLLLGLYPDLATAGLRRFAVQLKDGHEAPTTIVGSPEELICAIRLADGVEDNRLIECTSSPPDCDDETAASILASVKARGLNIWDQGIYRLRDLKIRSDCVQASFSLDRFMRYRVGIGALLDELLQALIDADLSIDTVLGDRRDYLPLRHKLLPDAESVASYRTRMCAGGIHATVAFLRPDPHDDFVIPIHRRSPSTCDGQNMISVIPQAFHQPTIDAAQEVRLQDTFFREFYEELFGGEEAVRGTRRLRHDWYTNESREVRWLRDHREHWRLMLSGFGLNLTSGNYEFALLCVIRDPGFWHEFSHKIQANWETTEADAPLVSTRDTTRIAELLSNPEWTPTGLMSFARGLDYLAELEPSRVRLPKMECVCL